MSIETYLGGHHLLTRHEPAAYPALLVVRPCAWSYLVIVPTDGQEIRALGGERLLPFRTARGAEAQGFTLALGDRATRLCGGGGSGFAQWRVERAESS